MHTHDSLRVRGLAIGLLLVAGVPGSSAVANDSFNMELVSHLPLSPSTDVSAAGDLVFVGRADAGVSIVDVTDPATPVVLSTWAHPSLPVHVNDPRPLGSSLFISNETGDTFGLFELDVSDPAAPMLIAALGPPEYPQFVHNLWPADGHLYLSGYGEAAGNVIVDASIPGSPQILSTIPVGIHDNAVVGNTLYIAGGWDGSFVYDVSDRTTPVELARFSASTPDTSYYAHNTWPIPGTDLVLQTEEVRRTGGAPPNLQGSLRLVDYADPANPAQVFRWYSENARDDSNITIHNIYVVGEFAFLSHYQDGVRVFDLGDPTEPVEVAWFDTFPETPLTLFEGCWGIDPFQGHERIFASDRTHGLFVLRFNGARKSTITGTVRDLQTSAPIPGAGLKSMTANRSTFADGAGDYTLATGAGVHRFLVTAPGYEPHTRTVVLEELQQHAIDFGLVQVGSIGVEEPVTEPTADPAPEALAPRLAPASPNPLNPTTTLGYDIPVGWAGRPLTLTIFDVRGARVRTLATGTARQGHWTIHWEGRNDQGRQVASGIYFARLQVGAAQRARRLVVAR